MSSAAEKAVRTDTGTGRTVIVTGATGLVGRFLVPMLLERGHRVQAISRRPAVATDLDFRGRAHGAPAASPTGVSFNAETHALTWRALDLEPGPEADADAFGAPVLAVDFADARRPADDRSSPGRGLEPAGTLVHSAPLWLLSRWLPVFRDLGVRRLVAFGSTSVFTKAASPSRRERELAGRLATAEATIETGCRENGMRWTILRPTLVYAPGRDRNVSEIARLLRLLGFFPVAGEGRGRRQPVHAFDLASAVLAVLDEPRTFDRAYDTPGGETLTFVEMVSRVAEGIGRGRRIVHVPLPLLRAVLTLARFLPGLRQATPEMADRMNEDLVFDLEPARRDFGYAPRPFRFAG